MKDMDSQIDEVDKGVQDTGDEVAGVENTDESSAAATKPPVEKKQELTEERIAEIAAKVTSASRRAEPKEEKQLSPAELKQLLNPVEVTKETLQMFGIAEPTDQQVKAYQMFADMISKHNSSMLNLALEHRSRQFEGVLKPLNEYVTKAQQERYMNGFYEANPALKKFEKLVRVAASRVSPTRADGGELSMDEAYKAVADETKTLLKEFNIDVDSAGGDETEANLSAGGSAVPKMASLAGAGRSLGGSGSKGKTNNPDASIYD